MHSAVILAFPMGAVESLREQHFVSKRSVFNIVRDHGRHESRGGPGSSGRGGDECPRLAPPPHRPLAPGDYVPESCIDSDSDWWYSGQKGGVMRPLHRSSGMVRNGLDPERWMLPTETASMSVSVAPKFIASLITRLQMALRKFHPRST